MLGLLYELRVLAVLSAQITVTLSLMLCEYIYYMLLFSHVTYLCVGSSSPQSHRKFGCLLPSSVQSILRSFDRNATYCA